MEISDITYYLLISSTIRIVSIVKDYGWPVTYTRICEKELGVR